MSDLISREALLTLIAAKLSDNKVTHRIRAVNRLIKSMPTVDAVEVVRCSECKYYIYQWKSDDEQVYGLCGIHGTADLKSADYCSHGERKEVTK